MKAILLLRLSGSCITTSIALAGLGQKEYVNKEWVKVTGLPDALEWTASTFDSQGNVIVVGNTLNAPGDPDALITKYDRDGNQLWQRMFSGDAQAQDYGTVVIADPTQDLDNGTYTGHRVEVTHTYSDEFPTTAQILDVWDRFSSTLGYSAATPVNGEWWGGYTHTTVGNTVTTTATTNCWFIEDGAGGYWIPAPPEALRTAYSIYVYDPTAIGIEENDEGWGFSAYPNPASDYLTVQLDLPRSGAVELEIFDVSGRMAMQLSLGRQQHLRKQLDIGALAKGVYQVVLRMDGKSVNRRFIKS